MDLSPSKVEKAREAIDFLSSLNVSQPSTSQPGPSTSFDPSLTGPSRSTRRPPGRNDKIRQATDNALAALDKLREGNKRKTVKKEIGGLFPSKNKKLKLCSWKHKFCCLASRDDTRSPTTDAGREQLARAGLGFKEIEFEDLYATQQEFHDIILENFPRLEDGGGFRFLKGVQANRDLDLLSMSVHKSPYHLKERVGTSRTYIRPVQRDLDISPLFEVADHPREKCLNCGLEYTLEELEGHIKCCSRSRSTSPEKIDLTTDENNVCELPTYMKYISSAYQEEDHSPLLQAAINESLVDTRHGDRKEVHTLKEAIIAVYGPFPDETCEIEVRRHHIMMDALKEARKSKFKASHLLKVSFVGEWAIDVGGPRREFFRKFGINAQARFLAGSSSNGKFFTCDMSALQNGDYYNLGRYISMSIRQGGSGFPFLHDAVFKYLCTGTTTGLVIATQDLPDATLRFACMKLEEANTDEDICVLFMMEELQALLLETGFSRPLNNLNLSDKNSLRSTLVDYHCMVKAKASIDHFAQGLGHALDLIRTYTEYSRPLFVAESTVLTAAQLKGMFRVQFTDVGSNKRPKEEQAWVFFGDFLDECQEGEMANCTLSDVLIFCSGSSCEPPLGFPLRPSISFIHDTGKLCTASTCDIELRLPTVHTEYEAFKEASVLSFQGNDGLGGGV